MNIQVTKEIENLIFDILEQLCSIYQNTELSPSLEKIWALTIGDLTVDQIEYAMMRTVREWKGTWMIPPQEFRAFAMTNQGNTFEDQATEAWVKVTLALEKCGCYQGVFFDDVIITETIRVLGGWGHLTHINLDKIEWFKKDFIKQYVSILKSGKKDFKNYLICSNSSEYLGRQLPRLHFVGKVGEEEKQSVLRLLKQEKELLKLNYVAGDMNKIIKIGRELKKISEQ